MDPPRRSSNMQIDLLALRNGSLDLGIFQRRLHPLFQERVNLLGRAADEARWVQQRVELVFDGVEVRVSADALDQVVLEAELLDLVPGFVGQDLCIEFRTGTCQLVIGNDAR